MSEEKTEKGKAPAAKPEGKGGPGIAGLLITAVLSGGAAFGGAKFGAGNAHAAPVQKIEIVAAKPPGPTVSLEPFIVTIPDADKKAHAMKLTLAIELTHGAKDEEFKNFLPRVRDATLTYLRALKYEDAQAGAIEKLRTELKERLVKLGAHSIDQVLVTDFVMQ